MKRGIDIAVSLLLLLIFLPFGLLISLTLRLTGEGEVFYRQQRVGRDRKMFGLFKFATMVKDSQKMGSKTITLKNDPRVLPVGRLLRRTKLNEVPQLLNVLLGEMSLVGPRPLTPETFGYYPPHVQERIVDVLPGLTGIGSIHFRDEESIIGSSNKPTVDCYREDIAPYKGELEMWYIANQSIWLDLELMALTALAVFFPKSTIVHRRVLKIRRESPHSN